MESPEISTSKMKAILIGFYATCQKIVFVYGSFFIYSNIRYFIFYILSCYSFFGR